MADTLPEIVEKRKLDGSIEVILLSNGRLILMQSHGAEIALSPEWAWTLLDLLHTHRAMLYQLIQHGKQTESEGPVGVGTWPEVSSQAADISFLELEDEAGQDIRHYLRSEEIVMPTVCPYCKLNPCICEDPSTFTLQEALASGARKFIAETVDEKATLTVQEDGYVIALQDQEHEFGLIFLFETPEELLADETVQRAANWNWQAAER